MKLAAIGDVVMALPMVSALLALDPATRITWMCGKTVAPLVQRVEGVAEVIVVDEVSLLAGSKTAQFRAVFDAWAKTRGRRFDVIYVAHTDARYQVLTWASRAAERYRLGAGPEAIRGMVSGRLHSNEYVRLVTGLDDHRARSFPPPAVDAQISQPLAQRLHAFTGDGGQLVGLAPGGAKNVARDNPLRRWPLDRYALLADALHDQGYRVVLTGDRTDGWTRKEFFDRPVLDLIGATNLPGLAAVLKQCCVVIAHDSGPLHLARLVQTPVVALLGPTPPSMFFRPDSSRFVLWPGGALPCAPCYDGYDFARCENNSCMQMISVESVISTVVALAPPEGTRIGIAPVSIQP